MHIYIYIQTYIYAFTYTKIYGEICRGRDLWKVKTATAAEAERCPLVTGTPERRAEQNRAEQRGKH